MTVRLRYPIDAADGRLCTVRGGPAAVCQFLGMVRDLAPGDFPGRPDLYNPCDRVATRDRDELLPELREHLRAFFAGLKADVSVDVEPEPDGGAVLGTVSLTGADWRVRIPVRQGSLRVLLDLDSAEEE